jgi:hypothetical protein
MSPLYRYLPLLVLTVVFLPALSIGQDLDRSGHHLKRHKPFDRTRNRRVVNELQRQQEFLRGVTSRFEAVALHDVTPLLQYPYVWTALHDNRSRMAKQVRKMTPDQSKQITKGYEVLESEVVASFGDYQLTILSEVLELNEAQLDDVQKAVQEDLDARKALLKNRELSLAEFTGRLNAISRKTEERIRATLFPEQQKRFEHEINFNRDRLVG